MTVTILPVESVKARLNAAFQSGKSQQLFQHKRGMAEYVSGVLGRTVLMDELTQLVDEELASVEAALLSRGSLDQPEAQQSA